MYIITEETYLEAKKIIELYESPIKNSDTDSNDPYINNYEVVIHQEYNPKYGDNRNCKCGHVYYRHFDSYEEMEACGCKYCQCNDFIEETKDIQK